MRQPCLPGKENQINSVAKCVFSTIGAYVRNPFRDAVFFFCRNLQLSQLLELILAAVVWKDQFQGKAGGVSGYVVGSDAQVLKEMNNQSISIIHTHYKS
jgi:hypothetical protein